VDNMREFQDDKSSSFASYRLKLERETQSYIGFATPGAVISKIRWRSHQFMNREKPNSRCGVVPSSGKTP
jgi:hypothetical protein